jgi:heme-degrading monooxygenase HmoA
MRLLLLLLPGLVAGGAFAQEPSSPVYEMRTYTTNEGKFDALLTRFSDHTMALFEKHGMENVAYWVPLEQPDTLIYVLEHQSRAAAVESWKAFSADPEWQAVYQASIADGRLVNNVVSVFMVKTDFSP